MRIVDLYGNTIDHIDEKLGYLVETNLLVAHHDATPSVAEVGHYEVIAEYSSGGKDVAWIVDSPGMKAKDAWDEYETVMQFVLYDAKQLAEMRISELKQLLRDTDYVVIKIAEGAATTDEYADVIESRKEWRKEINELEES